MAISPVQAQQLRVQIRALRTAEYSAGQADALGADDDQNRAENASYAANRILLDLIANLTKDS